jgi:hypothetical protein
VQPVSTIVPATITVADGNRWTAPHILCANQFEANLVTVKLDIRERPADSLVIFQSDYDSPNGLVFFCQHFLNEAHIA